MYYHRTPCCLEEDRYQYPHHHKPVARLDDVCTVSTKTEARSQINLDVSPYVEDDSRYQDVDEEVEVEPEEGEDDTPK